MLSRGYPSAAKVLLNTSNVKNFPKNDIYMELARAVQKLSIKRFDSVIGQLLKDPRVQVELPFYKSSLESMANSKYYHLAGLERTLEYYCQIFKAQAEKINNFIVDRHSFETLLFSSDYDACDKFLTTFKINYGESVWWLKAKLLVLFYKQNSDETQQFCDEILGRTGNCLFTYYIKSLIQCTHASSPLADLERKITKALEEFDKADIPAISWFLTKLCFPETLTKRDEDLESLHLLQQLPVIDLYHFATSAVLLYLNSTPRQKTSKSRAKNLSSH